MSDTLLVVYDGSASGDEGVRLACALAQAEDRSIEIVSVSVVPPSLPLGQLPKSFDDLSRMQLARARSLMRDYAVQGHTRVVRGYELARRVMQECERVEPAAVFLALDVSSSRWGIPYLPAIIRQMIRKAPCPVYIAHAPHPGYPTTSEVIREVEHVLQMSSE